MGSSPLQFYLTPLFLMIFKGDHYLCSYSGLLGIRGRSSSDNFKHVDVTPVWKHVEKDPISPDPQTPVRAFGFQTLNIAAEGILLHFHQRSQEQTTALSGSFCELPFGPPCDVDGPGHGGPPGAFCIDLG